MTLVDEEAVEAADGEANNQRNTIKLMMVTDRGLKIAAATEVAAAATEAVVAAKEVVAAAAQEATKASAPRVRNTIGTLKTKMQDLEPPSALIRAKVDNVKRRIKAKSLKLKKSRLLRQDRTPGRSSQQAPIRSLTRERVMSPRKASLRK